MAENNNNFKSTVEALFQGMDGMISSKTVVGDAIHVGDTIILPLVDVSFRNRFFFKPSIILFSRFFRERLTYNSL